MNTIMDKLISEGIVSSDIANQIQESFELKVQTEVEKRIEEKYEELEELQEAKIQEIEDIAEEWGDRVSEEMLENINDYLDLVVNNWISENNNKLDSLIESKRVDAMSEGLKALMITSGVTMTEIEESLSEEKAEELQESENIKNELDNLVEEFRALKKERDELAKMGLMKEMTEGLTMLQIEKLERLAESIPFDSNNVEAYINGVETLKESLFESKSLTESSSDDLFSFKAKTNPEKASSSLIGSASHLF